MNQVAARGREIVASIDATIGTIHQRHLGSQRLWMPSELIPSDYKPQALPPEIVSMLILNLLTEDGLPYFLSLLVEHLGAEHAIGAWSRTWTAEEDRHGAVIKQYLQKNLSRQQMIGVERLQYQYLKDGFWPDWGGDPVKLLAYVVLQEQATKVSHLAIGLQAASADPVLASILKRVAAEESKHHLAYFGFFQAALACDPSHALVALNSVIRSFEMPGKSIPVFDCLAEIQSRRRVFGATEFCKIVDDVVERLAVANITGLTEAGEKAREGIFKSLKSLGFVAERGLKRNLTTIPLPFLGDDFTVTA